MIVVLWCHGASASSFDLGMWNTLNLSYKINKHFSFYISEELRIKENVSRLNLLYTEIGITYRPKKWLRITPFYRHIDKYMADGYFSFRNRLALDILLRKKLYKKWLFSYRQRWQTEFRDFLTSEYGVIPEFYLRNKFELKYEFNDKWSTYGAYEIRFQIYNLRMMESNYYFHRNRFAVGLNYDLNKHFSIGVYNLFQYEYNVQNPQRQNVVGVEFNISL